MDSRYVVQNILPVGEVSILAGASGVGKSTLAMQMLAAIVNGETSFLGHEITYPQRIAYIAADRSWVSYTELAARVGLDISKMQTRSIVDDERIDVMQLEHNPMDLLHGLIDAFDSPTLVVVDPAVIFLGVDPNRYQQVAPRLIRWGRWCRHGRYTMLAMHHATKARSDYSFMRPQDRISGSSALLGFTSSQLFLSGADELNKPYAEFIAVNHNAPPEAIKLARTESGLFAPWQPEDTKGTLATLVMSTLSKNDKPLTKDALSAATKIDPKTLDDVLDSLVGGELIIPKPKGSFQLWPRTAAAITH